jgi:hypothetical protein
MFSASRVLHLLLYYVQEHEMTEWLEERWKGGRLQMDTLYESSPEAPHSQAATM